MNRYWMMMSAGFLICGMMWSAQGQQPGEVAGVISLRQCSIEYERSSEVGAIIDGSFGDSSSVLQDCLVKVGDRVKTDQLLGRLQYRSLQTDVDTAKAQSDNMLYIHNAEALHSQAKLLAERGRSLMEKRAMPAVDYNLLLVNERVAAIAIEQAKFDRSQASIKHQKMLAKFRNLEFRAPHDGVVVEILRDQGERMMNGESAFLVVDDSQIIVTGQLDIVDAWSVQPGQQARVRPEIPGADLPIEHEVFDGHVVFVDNRFDPPTYPATNYALPNTKTMTCKVTVRVPNRDKLLRSGMVASMEILPNSSAKSNSSLPTADLNDKNKIFKSVNH